MDKITTIANTTISDTTRVRPTHGEAAGVCWCAQALKVQATMKLKAARRRM